MGEEVELSDNEAIKRILAGETESFSILFRRYQRYVGAVVCKHVDSQFVEEVALEAFSEAFKSLSTYKGDSEFKHWLAKIAVRRCYAFWRKRDKNMELTSTNLNEEQEAWLDRAGSEKAREIFDSEQNRLHAKEVLSWALEKLSADDRMVLILLEYEERSVAEVAELLGWGKSKVKMRSLRAKKKLRSVIEKKNGK